jgi:hypothetical protein
METFMEAARPDCPDWLEIFIANGSIPSPLANAPSAPWTPPASRNIAATPPPEVVMESYAIGFGSYAEGDGGDKERFQQRYPIITSLIARMQKYSRRGVTIVDAPVGEGVSGGVGFRVCAIDWVVKKYHH